MNNSINNNSLKDSKSDILDWNLVQAEMKNKLGLDIYESWLKKITFVEEINNYILLSVPTRFIRDWITSSYLDQILKIIKNYKKEIVRIEFKITENKPSLIQDESNTNVIENKENVSFIKDSYLKYNRIDPNKNFENFITGSSNKFAYEASVKVSENISHYNPLYLYGGVAMGKTHLLNAIGYHLKKDNKVMFISAERFMYQFVKSIKSNDMVKFKEYFRNTDILLIDDIQFMNGKEAMQEEFFHTFNALLDKGSQIIVSADRPPNKLSRIQERIKSRFSGGLVVDIQNPDYDLRSQIIKSKTEELKLFYSNQITITDEIQKFISTEVRTSIRELVGALNRIVSFSRIYNKVPNISEVRVILKDLLNLSENKVTIDTIQTIVCKFFKISKNKKSLNVLDIGTGSGCIILTILKHCLTARGYAIDISNQALKVAKKNADKIGINKLRLKFSKTSFQKLANKKFDVIVTNPPYIPLHKIRGLSPEVRNYEPLIALDGGIDGLDVTKKIIYKSSEILKLNGILLIEIGYNQFKEISKTLKHKGYRIIRSIKDYSGHIRCIAAQKVR